MIRRIAVAASIAIVLLPAAAYAVTAQGQQMMQHWAGSDRCAVAAQRRYPDYTAEALAKRDLLFKQCLGASGLPPRDPLTPSKP
jgi:hypothetical protein